jgi:arylsulfatase A-like enzyme
MPTISRRGFLTGLTGLTATSFACQAGLFSRLWAGDPPDGSAPPPNLIIFLADDLGYADTGFQGCTDIPTPAIDAIATAGVRCTDGHVTCPVCAPTRAGLLTGRYQQRFGFEYNPGPQRHAEEDFGLPRTVPTLAERLQALGYATGMVGKWHLGFREELTPPRRGFDEFFGFLGGASAYLPRESALRAQLLRGTEPVEEREYLTTAFGREAAAFVDRHRDHPFFLYLPFNAVHSPLDADPALVERFAAITDPRRRTYATMLASLDAAIGRVLERVAAHGLTGRTLVVFLSDNGGPTLETSSRNDPLRGFKGQVYEGGIRVPFALSWPGVLPAGTVERRMVSSLDLAPTLLAAAGGRITPADGFEGVDLVPFLAGRDPGLPHDRLFWRQGLRRAARLGDWKLVQQTEQDPVQLYDLAADLGETRDLAASEPAKLAELEAAWAAWNAGNVEPAWVRQDGRDDQGREGQGRGDPGAAFRRLDRDGDGRVTPAELPDPRRFARFDRNGDGVITAAEVGADAIPPGATP